MSDGIRRESALAHLAGTPAAGGAGEAGVVIGERRFLGHYNLRGDARDTALRLAVRDSLGIELPTQANTVVSGPGVTVCWLGPDEWLVTTPYERDTERIDALDRAVAGSFVAITDVSGGLGVVTLEGARARDVLAKGCPLDLHERRFAVGDCAQTVLARASLLLVHRARGVFDIVVRRSFADYLWRWLVDASMEFGYRVKTPE